METLYFTLGIAFAFILVLAGMTVWATIKVSRMEQKLNQMKTDCETTFTGMHHDITMVDQTLQNSHEKELEALSRELDERVEGVYSYTDSRIDKLDNKVQTALPTDKQLLKG